MVWALARKPDIAVKLLADRIKPTDLAVPKAQFDKWVANLDSPQFRAREAAEKELAKVGPAVPVSWLSDRGRQIGRVTSSAHTAARRSR